MGSGGWGIPSIVEPDVIQFGKCEAKFVLHVEKGTVWNRFNEDRFWEKHNCILTHGAGQPPRGCRRLLQRLNQELKLPIICVLDCDPWGHYIYSVIKQGSISLAFESSRLAIPDAKFLGIRAKDYEECDLGEAVKIDLTDNDIKRANEIAAYPWFAENKAWQKEIEGMLKNGFKMEVEAMITKDISYVTEEYVPQRLKTAKDWLERPHGCGPSRGISALAGDWPHRTPAIGWAFLREARRAGAFPGHRRGERSISPIAEVRRCHRGTNPPRAGDPGEAAARVRDRHC
jgi:DNA topoisomerase-6 subunit A